MSFAERRVIIMKKISPKEKISKKLNPSVARILVFFLFFYLIYHYSAAVLTPKWKYPIDGEDHLGRVNEYKSLNSDPQVIFMGTSHVLYGVNPMQIYDETGISTYNLAVSGFDIGCGYPLLLDSLKYHTPKYLFLDASTMYLDFSDGSYVRTMGMIDGFSSKLALAKIYANDYISYHTEEDNKRRERIEKGAEKKTDIEGKKDWKALSRKAFFFSLSEMYRNHSRWSELNEYDFELKWPNAYMAKGYVFATNIVAGGTDIVNMNSIASAMAEVREVHEEEHFPGRVQNSDVEKSYYDPVPPEDNVAAFRRLKDLCVKNGIQLIIFKVPAIRNPVEYHSAWTDRRHEYMKKFAEEEGVSFFDILYDENETYDIGRDFIDGGAHCNYLGAKKVSKQLGNYMTNSCALSPEGDY